MYGFTLTDDGVSFGHPDYRKILLSEQTPLLIAFLIILILAFLPSLIKLITTKRNECSIWLMGDELEPKQFLPFNYYIILHLDRGLVSKQDARTYSKFRAKCSFLNNKGKKVSSFNINSDFLMTKTCLPPRLGCLRSLISYLRNLIRFLSFFTLTSFENDQIAVTLHRKKILDHITSIKFECDVPLKLKFYLHGLTVYSFNTNIAYYCSFEKFVQLNSSNRQTLSNRNSRLFCRCFDLFCPTYFRRPHPGYGCPIEYIYIRINRKLGKWPSKALQGNIAPVNRQTSIQLELLYYINVGKELKQELTDRKTPSIKAILAANLNCTSETIFLHLFNLSLLLFTLLFGLNTIIQNRKPTIQCLVPVVFISSFLSLLTTEFISNLYYIVAKRKTRFTRLVLLEKRRNRKEQLVFTLVYLSIFIGTLSLIAWSFVLSVNLKLLQPLNPFMIYKAGYADRFFRSKIRSVDRRKRTADHIRLVEEVTFLLIVYGAGLFIMFRFWTLVLSIIRLTCVRLGEYKRHLILSRFSNNSRDLIGRSKGSRLSSMDSIESNETDKKIADMNKTTETHKTKESESNQSIQLEENLLKYFFAKK